MQKFIKYFEEAATICIDFGETTKEIQFNEETQAIELFALTSINMCAQHSMSISTLIKNNLITDCFIIARNIIEVHFNLLWAIEGKTREKIIDRVYQLEANPFNNVDKEIKLMERNIDSNKPNLSKALILKHIEAIKNEKKKFPYLLVDKNNFQSDFKSIPPFADRMGKLRLLYYHMYRFASVFTHPSPKLKEVFMLRVTNQNKPTDTIIGPLKQTLSYCLFFVAECLACTKFVLFNFNPEHNPARQEMYNKLVGIFEESKEGYSRDPSNT